MDITVFEYLPPWEKVLDFSLFLTKLVSLVIICAKPLNIGGKVFISVIYTYTASRKSLSNPLNTAPSKNFRSFSVSHPQKFCVEVAKKNFEK